MKRIYYCSIAANFMETLALNDTQELHQSIQQLYTFHNLDTFGVDALSIIDRLVPSDMSLFHLTNTHTGQIQQTFLPNDDGVPPELNQVLNQVLSQYNFTERDRLILNLLHPHICQAYCNAQQHQRLAQELNQLQQFLHHLGVVVIDIEGKIQSIAPQAAIWLETYFSKPTGSLKLPDHLWSWVKHQATVLTQATDLLPAYLPLHIEQAGRELVIRLVVDPLDARYFLLLEEQTVACLHSLALLGLSQRETEVLSWVMQGKDNKTISAHLNIQISTVCKHLENIYLKWGVQSRTEAIAQALAKLGLLNSLTPN
jgi:DNA-binding CsgD family transcriptional regulator